MPKLIALLVTIAAGGLIALQAPVNAQLARFTSALGAAFISTAISALFIGTLLLVSGRMGEVMRLPAIPVGYLVGGILGSTLVLVSLVAVRPLGAGGLVAATVTGEIVISAALDRAGVLGLVQHTHLSPLRVVGFAMVLAGTSLVVLAR